MTDSTQPELTDEIKQYIEEFVTARLLKRDKYPTASIPATAIRQREITITGEQVQGGIIANFSSTGIDDRASECVLTLMDDVTVVENNLLTKDLTVKGNFVVEGPVPEDSVFYQQLSKTVTANVQASLEVDMFKAFTQKVTDTIKADGIDLKKITIDGSAVIEGKMLGFDITESFLQKVGALRELTVDGETLLAHTLYVTKKRVGINTTEPSAALSIWDQEVEVTVSKDKEGVAKIGTPRAQDVVLSANNKHNVTLHSDGTTEIADLRIGTVKLSSSDKPPAYTSTKGHIVFNTNPTLGGPMGWVCLGAANWANFGILD
jgi:hypothetical protein